jgi:hypothetical protein
MDIDRGAKQAMYHHWLATEPNVSPYQTGIYMKNLLNEKLNAQLNEAYSALSGMLYRDDVIRMLTVAIISNEQINHKDYYTTRIHVAHNDFQAKFKDALGILALVMKQLGASKSP